MKSFRVLLVLACTLLSMLNLVSAQWGGYGGAYGNDYSGNGYGSGRPVEVVKEVEIDRINPYTGGEEVIKKEEIDIYGDYRRR